jgi:NAD(P)-dependent dehydrogenase (short-subunit alcohol dehydrogenase family)
VNITSDAANAAYPGWGPYGASKAALELLTRTLAQELTGTPVSAVLVDPGDMRTGMHQDAFPGEDISDRPLPDVTVPFWRWLFEQDPERVRGQRLVAQQKEHAPWQLQPA